MNSTHRRDHNSPGGLQIIGQDKIRYIHSDANRLHQLAVPLIIGRMGLWTGARKGKIQKRGGFPQINVKYLLQLSEMSLCVSKKKQQDITIGPRVNLLVRTVSEK